MPLTVLLTEMFSRSPAISGWPGDAFRAARWDAESAPRAGVNRKEELMSAVIEVQHLHKSYGATVAADDISGSRVMPADLAGQVRAVCLALPEVTERLSHGALTWFVRG